KYVKHTSLGLASSISTTIFAPSISSAQENSNNFSKSNYKTISSNFSNIMYDVTDKFNLFGYKQVNEQSFQLKYLNVEFETKNPQLAKEFRRNIEIITAIQNRNKWLILSLNVVAFVHSLEKMETKANSSLVKLSKLIADYIGLVTAPDIKELLTSIGEFHKICVQEVLGWK
ncbi:hypothetical protein, partial [Bacillus mycoides]|uniref:hypothetical protein n=1 Tax=Bacillus mycoides TaxID=1405 RepID=UPI0021117402